MERFKRRFYDSHPRLPLDPDSDQLKSTKPMHTEDAHIAVVAVGAFAGTLARYQLGVWLPTAKDAWPLTTLLINVIGAFLLGVLLQALLHGGKDEGGRRILRLSLGTGFMGAFTTYSSLAASTALLARSGHWLTAAGYAIVSVVLGVIAAAAGIRLATVHHQRRGTHA